MSNKGRMVKSFIVLTWKSLLLMVIILFFIKGFANIIGINSALILSACICAIPLLVESLMKEVDVSVALKLFSILFIIMALIVSLKMAYGMAEEGAFSIISTDFVLGFFYLFIICLFFVIILTLIFTGVFWISRNFITKNTKDA